MGAGTTEVRDSTTDVLLEAAVWDPATVSRTQRRLHLVSEAESRYERTVDPAISVAALDRCAGPARGHREWRRRTHADRLAWGPAPKTGHPHQFRMPEDLPDRMAGVATPPAPRYGA